MNIWVVRFDFDQPHMFIGDKVYMRCLTDEYMRCRAAATGPSIFVV
jgi:hypothetical protein